MRKQPCPCSTRDPIENAFYGFMSLSPYEKLAMIARFNAHQRNAAHPMKLILEEDA